MLGRLPFIICVIVTLDLLFKVLPSFFVGWRVPLTAAVATAALGVLVILYYQWRWSEAVTKRLEAEPGLLDSESFAKMLLLVAGIMLLVPGILTDTLAVVLLVPWVRRQIAGRCNLCR